MKLFRRRKHKAQQSAEWLRFECEREHLRSFADTEVIAQGEVVAVPPARLFPEETINFYGNTPAYFSVPPITMTEYLHTTVRALSNMVTTHEVIFHHRLFDFERDIVPEIACGDLIVSADWHRAKWAHAPNAMVGETASAADLTDALSFNYAHWLTELLPRAFSLAARPELASLCWITDAELHANQRRALSLLSGTERPIHFLKKSQAISVAKLHHVSPAGYIPYNRHPADEGTYSHGVFSGWALKGMAQHLCDAIDRNTEAPPKRIYVKRAGAVRNLVGEHAIEAGLHQMGFRTIQPELMSFDEQVRAFSEADIIVGATGSAIANIVFCKPHCPIIIMIPRFLNTAYWYWHNIAAAIGCTVIYVSGDQVGAREEDAFTSRAPHADFVIEPAAVFAAVESVRQTGHFDLTVAS